MIASLDTETTGVDLQHSARPFFVTFCYEDFSLKFFEWDVNPLTRQPIVPYEDLEEINALIDEADQLVLQNPKFDFKALDSLQDHGWVPKKWDWSKVLDTLMAGHLLASNQPHDLTTMALVELGVNIKPYEEELNEAIKEARRIAKSRFPEWKIAKRGLEGMPSAKESVGKFDMWLPRAIAKAENYPSDHPWWTILSDYSNADSSVTLPLIKKQLEKIEVRGLRSIYNERLKLLPIIYGMESRGITYNKQTSAKLKEVYTDDSEVYKRVCINVAGGNEIEFEGTAYVLEDLPLNGASNSLRAVMFGKFALSASRKTGTGKDSMDKAQLEEWLETLPSASKAHTFIKNLRDYRKRRTAISYIESYDLFKRDIDEHWARLYPSLNPTGTHTLRWSSQNPNEQQISKQELETLEEDEEGERQKHNAREMFGPLPDEEWWSCDAQNIERRIPVYDVGEKLIIDLFERPDDPPYFGSEHSLVAHILHPKEFEACGDGKKFKEKYKSTLYQWTKNFNFALQYGCQEAKGDATAHVKGAFKKVKSRFKALDKLNQAMIDHANQFGYIETMPDETVNPNRGYPLYCERTKWGKVSPTIPLSYRVQGTAMWWMMKAMIRVEAFLQELNQVGSLLFRKIMGRHKTEREQRIGYHIVLQVHDELVYKCPKGMGKEPWKTNRPVLTEIQRIMALGGDDIGVPLPVGCEYHPISWGQGKGM